MLKSPPSPSPSPSMEGSAGGDAAGGAGCGGEGAGRTSTLTSGASAFKTGKPSSSPRAVLAASPIVAECRNELWIGSGLGLALV